RDPPLRPPVHRARPGYRRRRQDLPRLPQPGVAPRRHRLRGAGRRRGRAGAVVPVRAHRLFRRRPLRPRAGQTGVQPQRDPARHLGDEGMMLYAQVHLTLPAWVHDAVDSGRAYASDADKIRLAIELSRHNIDADSGGPFGAAVFGPDDRIIAVGVNRVVPHACSVAHAEMMAYMLAQGRTQRLRLNRDADDNAIGPITLATSAQPCCQCYGATIWAGIDRLLIGARSQDV